MNSPQEKSFKNFSKHVFGKLLLNKFFSRNTPNTFCEEKKNECWLIWVDPVDSIKKMEVKQKGSEQKDLASTHTPIIILGPIFYWGLNITFASLMSLSIFLLKLLLVFVHWKYYKGFIFCEHCWVNSHHNLCRTLSLSWKFTNFTDGYLWPALLHAS